MQCNEDFRLTVCSTCKMMRDTRGGKPGGGLKQGVAFQSASGMHARVLLPKGQLPVLKDPLSEFSRWQVGV